MPTDGPFAEETILLLLRSAGRPVRLTELARMGGIARYGEGLSVPMSRLVDAGLVEHLDYGVYAAVPPADGCPLAAPGELAGTLAVRGWDQPKD